MMRLRKSQPDAPKYNEGRRTRSRASTRRPQDESISESANAISIEIMTVLSSNTEIAQLRRGLTDRRSAACGDLPSSHGTPDTHEILP